MVNCPSENVLVEFAEGRLGAQARQSVHQHIDSCAECRALISDLACAEADAGAATAVLAPQSAPQAKGLATAGAPVSQRFQIIRKLGQGGMGVVYEALDRRHDSRVALKTLRSMNPDALLRFKNEFRALQDLQHPNLVRLADLVEEDGQWWFTMELLFGVDFLTYVQKSPEFDAAMSDRIRSVGSAPTLSGPVAPSPPVVASAATPLSLDGVIDEGRLRAALVQLGQGLNALHGAGKVHRDIKPQNVMVTSAGRVVILDFGLVGDRAQQDSAVVGTIAYMAPEQAAVEPTGPAADWYSVGVMLYEALTGGLPAQGGMMEMLAAKLRSRPLPPRARNPNVPPDLDLLCSELLDPDPAQRPGGDEILARLRGAKLEAEGAPAALLVPSSAIPPFVGRKAELGALKDALTRSRAGQAELLLVEGESGVGKSALVRHFIGLLPTLAPDAVVLVGRCYEREAVPYKAFDGIVDALSRYMKRLPKDKACALLPRRAAALLQAFPVLGRISAMAEAPAATEAADPKEQRIRVFAALRELFARLCERQPVLLWIDDLQWSDADSLALLVYLMSSPDAPPLLLLCTLRPLHGPRPAGLSEESLRPLRHVERISIGPLPVEDACELAEQLVQQGEARRPLDLRAIAKEAGGHPLFLDELIRRAQEAPAQTAILRLDDAIWARVMTLPEAAQRVLGLCALSGRPLRPELALAASALSHSELAEWVAQLSAAHLLRTTPLPESSPGASGAARAAVEPYHDRVRETIAERLDAAQRRVLHRALATALEGAKDPEPELLALHYRAAGELLKSGRYAAQAAAQAAKQLAFERAAELYRSALDSGAFTDAERVELLAALGEALGNAGWAADAGRAYLHSAERAEPERALVLRQRAANQLLRGGQVDEGVEILNGLLHPFGLRIGSSSVWAICKTVCLGLWLRLRGSRYRLRKEHEIQSRDLLRHDLCWMVNLALTSGLLGPRGIDFTTRVVLQALRLGEPRRVARALSWLGYGMSVSSSSSTDSIVQHFSSARALLHEQQIEDPYTLGFIDLFESWTFSQLGQFRRARQLAERAEQSFLQHCPGTAWEVANARFVRLLLGGLMGDYAALSVEMPRLLRESRERKDRTALKLLGSVHAQPYFLAADSREDAERTLALWELSQVDEKDQLAFNHHLHMQVRIALYFDGGRAAYRRYTELWTKLSWPVRYMVRGSQKADLLLLRATCGLSAITDGELDRERLFKDCDKALQKVSRIHLPWADAWALGLSAMAAMLRGRKEAGVALLRQAIPQLESVDLHLHAAACQRRLGETLGAEEGAALIAQADHFMREQTIKNPSRITGMLLPQPAAG